MSAICQNCKSKLSCGCQKRTASNGTPVCSVCLLTYENSLKNSFYQIEKPLTKSPTAPSNVTVLYQAPVN
jgi:hypothetical protein